MLKAAGTTAAASNMAAVELLSQPAMAAKLAVVFVAGHRLSAQWMGKECAGHLWIQLDEWVSLTAKVH